MLAAVWLHQQLSTCVCAWSDSDAAGAGPSSTAANSARAAGVAASLNAGQSAAAARLFEKVPPLPQEAEQAAAAAAAAAAASSSGAGERSRLASALAGLGNALFFAGLGAGAFFGYYTARYTSDQVETMVEQTKEPENSFPGSPVRPACLLLSSWASSQLRRPDTLLLQAGLCRPFCGR